MPLDFQELLGPNAPLDPAYAGVWAPDLADWDCRKAMLADARIHGRIVDDILTQCFGHADPLPEDTDFAERDALTWVLRKRDSDFLTDVGLMWHAPALAPGFVDRQIRTSFEELDRSQMRACMRFRDHAPAEMVGLPADLQACRISGVACLSAWMQDVPPAIADRVKLLFPPAPIDEDAAVVGARIALFKVALADLADIGGSA